MYEYLQEKGKDFPLLYVEDNNGLREKALRFFKKFFSTVYVGKDGEEGLALYKEHQPKLIVTDIKMPKLNGLDMIKKIKLINPNVKVIVTTAFDDKEFLINSIKIGIFRYVNKPFNIKEITNILTEAIEEIEKQEGQETFNQNIQDIFNFQDNLLVLLEDGKPIIANYNFLKFFNIESIKDFSVKNANFEEQFLEEEKFLFGKESLKIIQDDVNSLYNIKMKKDDNYHHFILKVKKTPTHKNQYIFSFSDITELGLLKSSAEKSPTNLGARNLMQVIVDNNATVKIHNYYKGLSISNDATITSIDENELKIKVNYLQAKALQKEKLFILSSSFLPKNIMCQDISEINYSTQEIVAKKYSFIDTSPTRRLYTRVQPEETHKAFIFFNSIKYDSEVRDISTKSVRIKLKTFPNDLKVNSTIKINILLKHEGDFIIQSTSEIIRIDKHHDSIDIIMFFNVSEMIQKTLVEYISHRQLTLIKEFKKLERDSV